MTLRAARGPSSASLVQGRFKGIQVITRGRSPRIVAADVVGSRGRTRVDGATLRARFGLYDTWAYFTSITSRKAPKPLPPDDGDGGSRGARRSRAAPKIASLAGSVDPAPAAAPRSRSSGASAGSGSTAGTATARRGGRYRYGVTAPGLYRVRHKGDNGPAVRVR